MLILIIIAFLIISVQIIGYYIGKHKQRVFFLGKDTYWRFYPNPGVGFKYSSQKRIALSWMGGFETFKMTDSGWRINKSFLSRIKRPGGK